MSSILTLNENLALRMLARNDRNHLATQCSRSHGASDGASSIRGGASRIGRCRRTRMASGRGSAEAFIDAVGHLCHRPLAPDDQHCVLHARWHRPDLPDRTVSGRDWRNQRLTGSAKTIPFHHTDFGQTGVGGLKDDG